jgi:DNA-binding protein HU-beta
MKEGNYPMNKNELISAVAEATGVSKKDTDAVIKATFDAITKAIANGDKVQLIGFGTFETRERAERTGINPLTKEKITVAASKVPAFKAGKALKDAVNK